MLRHEEAKGKNVFGQRFYKKKIACLKKVKNICLNSSVANTDRHIISKTNCLKQNLNDGNPSFESNKESSNVFQSIKIHRLKNPKDIEIDNVNVNSLKNKFEAAEELVQNKVDICFFSETKTDETFQNQ